MREEYLKPTKNALDHTDHELERALRPLTFLDFTGQSKLIANLKRGRLQWAFYILAPN